MSRRCAGAGWPLERVLFLMAGAFTLASALIAAFVTPWLLLLTVLVGVSQLLYVTVGACPTSLVLTRLFKLSSVVYPADGSPR